MRWPTKNTLDCKKPTTTTQPPSPPPPYLELAKVVGPLEDGLEVLVLGGGAPVNGAEVNLSGATVDRDHVVLLQLHPVELRCVVPFRKQRRGERKGVWNRDIVQAKPRALALCPHVRALVSHNGRH